MLILFVRTIILYCIVLFTFRLTGKRQLSDLQPFDLIITLLIADLASEPAGDTGVPLIYGIVPILALMLLQQLISFLSLKSRRFRAVISGTPLIVVRKGILVEKALKTARYSINDLMEQMRAKDVFTLSSVEYAILETNGEISILKKGAEMQPTYAELDIMPPDAELPLMIIEDGKICKKTLDKAGFDTKGLKKALKSAGIESIDSVFFAFFEPAGNILHVQSGHGEKASAVFIDMGREHDL